MRSTSRHKDSLGAGTLPKAQQFEQSLVNSGGISVLTSHVENRKPSELIEKHRRKSSLNEQAEFKFSVTVKTRNKVSRLASEQHQGALPMDGRTPRANDDVTGQGPSSNKASKSSLINSPGVNVAKFINLNSCNNLPTPTEFQGSTESRTHEKIMNQYVSSAQRIEHLCEPP